MRSEFQNFKNATASGAKGAKLAVLFEWEALHNLSPLSVKVTQANQMGELINAEEDRSHDRVCFAA